MARRERSKDVLSGIPPGDVRAPNTGTRDAESMSHFLFLCLGIAVLFATALILWHLMAINNK